MKLYLFIPLSITLNLAIAFSNTLLVKEVKGKVRYRNPETLKVVFLKKGLLLKAGGKVKLQESEYLKLYSEMGDSLIFKNKSYFKIESLSQNKKQSQLELNLYKGFLNCKVKPLRKGSIFSVQTPSAITQVRGTDFNVAVDNNDNTSVSVNEGLVAVKENNSNQEASLISEGKTCNVSSNGGLEIKSTPSTTTTQSSSSDIPNNSEAELTNNEIATQETSGTSEVATQLQGEVEQQQNDQKVERLINLKFKINDKD